MSRPPRVAIIGGGYAGMAAAVTLCELGATPTVFETTSILGGRARRVESDRQVLDNGLHILIGAYRETLRMMALVHGTPQPPGVLRMPLDLQVHGRFRMRAGNLPAPLNVLTGLLGAQGLSAADKWCIARLMLALRLRRYRFDSDLPLSAFLQAQRQTVHARRLLWDPLCIAALNTHPDQASTATFAAVLRDTFAPPAGNSDLLLPTRDFSSLFPEPAAGHIARRGGTVRLSTRVTGLRSTDREVRLSLRDDIESFDAAIIAVAPQHVGALAREEPGLAEVTATIGAFTYRPIHSVYLGYPPHVRMPVPMLGLPGPHAQWVFDRGQLAGEAGMLGVVISADGAHETLDHDALAQTVHQELRHAFPDLPAPIWHRVIAEKRATIASTVDLHRPEARTPCPRVFLAGDYVRSAYPATLEAAVRSGIEAAKFATAAAMPVQ